MFPVLFMRKDWDGSLLGNLPGFNEIEIIPSCP